MLPNYTYHARCISVYDGDSITLDVDLGFKFFFRGIKVRLLDVFAPEIRGEERSKGLIVRDYLRDLILNKDIVFVSYSGKTGKYGRYLGTIYQGDRNINALLNDYLSSLKG